MTINNRKKSMAGKQAIDLLDGAEIVATIIKGLRRALADEWLAHYQYWVGAQVVRGLNRKPLAEEMLVHSDEEKGHAQQLSDRIIELGGNPILDPSQWMTLTNCGYTKPKSFQAFNIVEDNIRGEQCAIAHYNRFAKWLKGKDDTTYLMIMGILAKEQEHEEDLSMYLEDMADLTNNTKGGF